MYKLILLRHGESIWEQENRFTGWSDPDLSEKGKEEARHAGDLLKSFHFRFDICYTSYLQRAIKTQYIIAEEMGLLWVPVIKNWRLNERHYGALQELSKTEITEKYGEEQVMIWRRSYDARPPQISDFDPRFPAHDIRYEGIDASLLSHGESLQDTVNRVLPCWELDVAPVVKQGKTVLIVAHGNSLRALEMHLLQLTPEEIVKVEIPVGKPVIFELDKELKTLKYYFLG